MRNVDWGKVLTVLTPVAAGLWAVWRWIAERRADRQSERNRLAAQYVSPFLFACQDLQSRLYNILCRGGLDVLGQRPNAPEELLYLVAQYFAFESLLLRYTPYSTDPKLLRLIERVRDRFASASSKDDMDPWCIFRHQQRALGQFVLVRRHDEPRMALDVMPLTRFVGEFGRDDQAEAKSLQVDGALRSLRGVDHVCKLEPLRSRHRLAEVQDRLVDLLDYLEDALRGRRSFWRRSLVRKLRLTRRGGARYSALDLGHCQGGWRDCPKKVGGTRAARP